jgi:hypothetical protein
VCSQVGPSIQTCLLIIDGWNWFVSVGKLIKITGTIHVTLKFHQLVVFFNFFSPDFT